MALTIDIRDEWGQVLERWEELPFALAAAMPSFTSLDFPYLRLVDPYSNTWFSSYQMVAVIPELERLAEEEPGPAVAKALEMAVRCRDTNATYLVFIGD